MAMTAEQLARMVRDSQTRSSQDASSDVYDELEDASRLRKERQRAEMEYMDEAMSADVDDMDDLPANPAMDVVDASAEDMAEDYADADADEMPSEEAYKEEVSKEADISAEPVEDEPAVAPAAKAKKLSEKKAKVKEKPSFRPAGVSHKTDAASDPVPRGDMMRINYVPTAVVNALKDMFPNASSNARRVALAVLTHPKYVENSIKIDDEEVERLLKKERSQGQHISDLYERIQALEARNQRMTQLLMEIETGLVYIICDRTGFRRHSIPDQASELDMAEDDMVDLLRKLKADTTKVREQDRLRNGRPKR